MIDKSFRVIDIASKLQTKNMGWMKESGSNWPWHITFWDHSGEPSPKFIVDKKIFGWIMPDRSTMLHLGNETKVKLLARLVKVNNTGDKGIIYEAA